MANITAADVMKLRQMTGVSMMECKKALLKTEGDYDAAVKLLRELGAAVSAKRAEKTAKEGLVYAKKCPCGSKIAIVEVNCETDFVANSADFKAFIDQVADAALDGRPTSRASSPRRRRASSPRSARRSRSAAATSSSCRARASSPPTSTSAASRA